MFSMVDPPDRSEPPAPGREWGSEALRKDRPDPDHWAREKHSAQNPRIRALLAAIRRLEEVRESEFALLHCSSERLMEIWDAVAEVALMIEEETAPLLFLPSKIPTLEAARQRAVEAYRTLERETLGELLEVGRHGDDRSLAELRRRLSLSIGSLAGFLQTAFGDIMAADPRSRADPDYFLSKRFARDVADAERLYLAVERLQRYLETVDGRRRTVLLPVLDRLESEGGLPRQEDWQAAKSFFHALDSVLVAKLWELVALQGIRFYEAQILDRYACLIPSESRIVVSLYAAAHACVKRIEDGERQHDEGIAAVREALAAEVAGHVRGLDLQLRNLIDYIPQWLGALGRRRALLIRYRDKVR